MIPDSLKFLDSTNRLHYSQCREGGVEVNWGGGGGQLCITRSEGKHVKCEHILKSHVKL
jgi:hypothetical protein